jgi:hypothetical protein
MAADLVSARSADTQDERLEFLDVVMVSGEVHTEAVPKAAVAISNMTFQAPHEVTREADVVEVPASVQRIDARTTPDQLSDDHRIRFNNAPRDVFEVLVEQMRASRHGQIDLMNSA